MNTQAHPARIVIQGLTQNGRQFRPSDWAERLQDCIATHGVQKSSRLHNCMSAAGLQRKPSFSHHVYISFRNGIKSLIVERKLMESNPMQYQFLLSFAKDNDLMVIEDWMEEGLKIAA